MCGGVAATALMQWAKHAKRVAPGHDLQRLCVQSACSHAARCGNREVVQWLRSTGCTWNAATPACIAGGGHLEVVKWLHNHGCPWDNWTCAYAARSGHLHVLKWARVNHCPWSLASERPAYAAEGGHLVVLQWAVEHDCPWDSAIAVCAARAGQLEVLKWVRENDATGVAWNEDQVRYCADGSRKQEVLAWLDELSAP